MDLSKLAGKTVLVTGAARRIGRAIALCLAARGSHILAHYYNSEREINLLREELQPYPGEIHTLQANLNCREEVDNLFSQAVRLAGNVDILINNASVFNQSRLMDFSAAELSENIQVNSFAPLQLCRCFVNQQTGGDIINLLDTRILDYDREHTAYHLSKRLLFSLTRMMAWDFAPAVKVNAIAPGVILPPQGKDDTYYREMVATNPLHTHGRLSDITDAVLFLLTNSFITGQILYIDGGRHMKGRMYGS